MSAAGPLCTTCTLCRAGAAIAASAGAPPPPVAYPALWPTSDQGRGSFRAPDLRVSAIPSALGAPTCSNAASRWRCAASTLFMASLTDWVGASTCAA